MHAQNIKLGKRPASIDARDLKFSAYRAGSLPAHPRTFGHEKLVPDWAMLANDAVGDCTIAGAAHETMLFNAEAGRLVRFTDEGVLSDYSAITGYDPSDPSTDQGADMRDVLKYRRKVGVIDAAGVRHKIGGFVALRPGDVEELMEAAWLFGAVAIGIQVPSSAMEQFDARKPWSVVHGSSIEGGHYIPGAAVRGAGLLAPFADTLLADYAASARDIVVVTWGMLQAMTFGFYRTYCDEAFALLSEEMVGPSGKTLEGFDLAALRADLAQVAA